MIAKSGVFAASDIGLVKKENQDAFLVLAPQDRKVALLAVSDGMGGEQGGAQASALALETVRQTHAFLEGENLFPEHRPDVPAARMRSMVLAAHEAVCRAAKSFPAHEYMGATLTVVCASDTLAAFGHVGDSRLYRLRKRRLQRITRDHRFLDELVEAGDMTEEEARNHPLRNKLDMALGTPGCEADSGVFDLSPGDRLLLCSDGLTDEVPEVCLEEELNRREPPQQTVARCIQAALALGGRDNVTVLVADVGSSLQPGSGPLL